MNYIYDIVLNLNKGNLFDFYEWRDSDNPEFILKIPLFKVDDETFLDFKNNDIIINKKFLDAIENKTETYSPNCIGIIRYACVFVNFNNAIAIEFDSEGNNYMKSSISIEEESEILDSSKNLKFNLIDYKVKKKIKKEKIFATRSQLEIEKYLIKKISNMKNNNELSKLKYIYYEMYEEKNEDIEKIYNKLLKIIKNHDYKFIKLNNILNVMENKKIMSNNS